MRAHSCQLMMVILLAGGVGIAQQPIPPRSATEQPPVAFRADANFVEVHAVVTDDRGNFVSDLSKDDFEIFEDGKRQTVSAFAIIDLPIVRRLTPIYATEPVEPDVRATVPAFDGRLYVLMLDDLHTSMLRTPLVRTAARRFVEQGLGANDLAAVVYTSGRGDAGQEMTANRALLLAAVDRFQGRKPPSLTAERLGMHLLQQNLDSLGADPNAPQQRPLTRDRVIDEPYDPERAFNARRALESIKDVAEWAKDVYGRRKALVLFSEGIEYDIYAPFFSQTAGASILADARDAIAAAQRANVSIYAVDARGLTLLGDEAIDVRGLSRDPAIREGGFLGFQRQLLMAQESLHALVDETGGIAVVNTNDIAGGLGRIVRENSTYYLLGYSTDLSRSRGTFRSIDVRVKRPGLRVRARRGFVPPDPRAAGKARELDAQRGTSPALKAALNNPLPVGDLSFRVFAAPFKGSGKNASVLVAIEIDGGSLKFVERAGRFSEKIEASIIAVDAHAEVQGGDRQEFELNLRPETHELVRRNGVRLLSRLELPPSRYQIRVGAYETNGGTVGTVPFDLELPDYSKTPFALSGLVLTSAGAASLPTPNPDSQFGAVFPTPPSATRVFPQQDTIGVFAELYDSSTPLQHDVDLLATVRDVRDGRSVFTVRDNRKMEPSDRLQTHGYKVEIPLKDVAPGMYVLRVEATARATGQTASREVPFEVNSKPE